MVSVLIKARTAWALGLLNLVRVLMYRFGVSTGLNPVHRLKAKSPEGVYFRPPVVRGDLNNALVEGGWLLFGHVPIMASDICPDWHVNPVTGSRVPRPERPWWEIPDFDSDLGDIKAVWEVSRLDWGLMFAQQAVLGRSGALSRLNNWLADWVKENPPYFGPNWKCGQEASIRVMHLAMAAWLMGQTQQPNLALLDLVELHIRRIVPTILYAVAQDNNHGTSEAAALFIGGSWLDAQGREQGGQWADMGRRWLENRAERLILSDGSFSQYSLNYHRVVLDTFSMVELWRSKLDLPKFSDLWYARSRAAVEWLYVMVRPENGDGPNLGANDGARLLPLTSTDYRDYRPSVQLAMVLFARCRAYVGDGRWNWPLAWLEVEVPEAVAEPPGDRVFDRGGFAVLRRGNAMAMLRYPRFRFRPSQADALHLDFWRGARNLLRDAGTYSYNAEEPWLEYFPGTVSHNTIQFDDRDQMPRLSRFLFGDWLKTAALRPLLHDDFKTTYGASYIDLHRAYHRRDVELRENRLVVRDQVGGFREKAVLRWRLEPGEWVLEDLAVRNKQGEILSIESDGVISDIRLIQGWESRYYLKKTVVPVLEIELHVPACIVSTYAWIQSDLALC